MSYAVRRPVDPSRSGGGATPTTAAVLDYTCLFTHDLRRKQKRWKDGRLTYHTFNKRIMVYDDRGNVVGDAHWQAGGDLAEGEELQLDRGSAIVQVADCTGRREQDLSEVLDKRAREVEARRAASASSSARATVRRQDGQPHFQLSHRPLSAIVPSPGPLGRAAVSARSPYEARRVEARAEAPAAKRRRVSLSSPPSKASHSQGLFGARLTLSSCSAGPTSARAAREGRVEDEHEDVVVLVGPSREQAKLANSAHLTTRPASVAAARGTSCRAVGPNADANKDTKSAQRQPAPELSRIGSRSNRISGPDLKKGMQREKVRDGGERARPTMDQAYPAAPIGNEEDDAQSCAQRRRIQNSTPSPKRRASTERGMDTPLRPCGEEHTAPPTKAEPRTELRIKPRQRRGLLMLSEQKQPREEAKKGRLETAAHDGISPEMNTLLHPQSPDREPEVDEACNETSKPGPSRRAARALAESSSESDAPPVGRVRKRHTIRSVSAESSSESNTPPVHRWQGNRRKTREADSDDLADRNHGFAPARRTESCATSEDESSLSSPPRKRPRPRDRGNTAPGQRAMKPSGPRIMRMARKSLKSKEIVGFVLPARDGIVPAPFATAAGQIAFGTGPAPRAAPASASDMRHADTTVPSPRDPAAAAFLESKCSASDKDMARPAGAATSSADTHRKSTATKPSAPLEEATRKQSSDESQDADTGKRKILNPATRGKKAARKEDAAGQAPQSVVPMELAAAPVRTAAAAAVQPKEDAGLPGFSRANGGAWSRHAEDLLGMARPMERTRL